MFAGVVCIYVFVEFLLRQQVATYVRPTISSLSKVAYNSKIHTWQSACLRKLLTEYSAGLQTRPRLDHG